MNTSNKLWSAKVTRTRPWELRRWWIIAAITLGSSLLLAAFLAARSKTDRATAELLTMDANPPSEGKSAISRCDATIHDSRMEKRPGPISSDWTGTDPLLKEVPAASQGSQEKSESGEKHEAESVLVRPVDVSCDKQVYRLSQDKEIRVTVSQIRWPKPGMRLTSGMVSKARLNWDLLSDDDLEVRDCFNRSTLLRSQPATLEDPGDPLELPYTFVFSLSKVLQGRGGNVACGHYCVSLEVPSYIESVASDRKSIYVRP